MREVPRRQKVNSSYGRQWDIERIFRVLRGHGIALDDSFGQRFCLSRGMDYVEPVYGVHALPAAHRRRVYTTNILKRLMREIKRRTRVVGIFPNEASCDRLKGNWWSGTRPGNANGHGT